MNVMIVEEENEARDIIRRVIESELPEGKVPTKIVQLKLLQDAIELLERQETLFDLIVFSYSGTGQALVNCLIEYGGTTAYLMVAPDPTSLKAFTQPDLRLEYSTRSDLETTLPQALKRLQAQRAFGDLGTPDDDFVPLKIETLKNISPVSTDIWIKLAPNRYLKLIRKGTELVAEDFSKFKDVRRAELLYVKKKDADSIMDKQVERLTVAAADPNLTEEQGDRISEASLEALAGVVDRVGFTPKAQALAKQSVAVTLRLIGARPRLQNILEKMGKQEGKYIASHSLSLGKIACALAYKLEWNSAATYLKLTLAAFLHDLPLHDNDLASFTTLEAVKKSERYSQDAIAEFKMHPLRAAEYAKQFHEIPSDVDIILSQHHEQPDGTGFPRGLTHKYISPLSALFIVAHDILHYMLDHRGGQMAEFFRAREDHYSHGNFKKIFRQLAEGEWKSESDSG